MNTSPDDLQPHTMETDCFGLPDPRDEAEPRDCPDCDGTGIGNPHTGTGCPCCGGVGVKRRNPHPDDPCFDEYDDYDHC